MIINRELAGRLPSGWEQDILAHGDVLTKSGAFILDDQEIHKAIANDGEIEYRCRVVRTSEKSRGMPCDNHGVIGCQQKSCQIWLT